MRNIVKSVVLIGFSVLIGAMLLEPTFGDDNASIDVVMTIQSLSIARLSLSSVTIAAPLARARVTQRVAFKNDGDGNENFSVRLTSTSGSWTSTQNSPGANQYRLSAIWHRYDVDPSADEFGTDDVLFPEGSLKDSSDTVLYNNNETHSLSTDTVKGYNVAPNGERNLFFKFESPTSGSGSSRAHVHVFASTPQ